MDPTRSPKTSHDSTDEPSEKTSRINLLSPVSYLLTNQRIASWTQAAKERVEAVRFRRSTDRSDVSRSSMNISTDSNTDSFASYEEEMSCSPLSNGTSEAIPMDRCRRPTRISHALASPRSASTSSTPAPLHHQSKSFPSRLQRTPSISSQSSVDSAPPRQSVHRSSSPQIRAFGPDGRTTSATESSNFQIPRELTPRRFFSFDTRGSLSAPSDTHEPCSPTAIPLTPGGTTPTASGHSPNLLGYNNNNNGLPSPSATTPTTSSKGIDPNLYHSSNEPIDLTTIDDHPFGRIRFRLSYNTELNDLIVNVLEAYNIPKFTEGGLRDPKICVLLEPAVDSRERGSESPSGDGEHRYFNKTFKFPISIDQLPGRELIFCIVDSGQKEKINAYGEARVKLANVPNLTGTATICASFSRKEKRIEPTQLYLSLNYLPHAERLTVFVFRATNVDTDRTTCVKVCMFVNEKRLKKKKTSASTSNDAKNPAWNESFVFTLKKSNIRNARLEFSVFAQGGEAICSCSVGSDGKEDSWTHWRDMTQPTSLWLQLE